MSASDINARAEKGRGPRPRQGLWKGRGSLCRTRWRYRPSGRRTETLEDE
jgi:hypothetical protein